MLTLPYLYNWQKFNQKNKWKKKPGVLTYGPWICNWANYQSYPGASFEMILSFDFGIVLKILICFSLIKCFPNDHKRYSSHLPLPILHRVAPIKVYLTIYESLKNSYLKLNKCFWFTSIQRLPYLKATVLGLKLVYSFINFIIPWTVAYIKHSWGNYQRLAGRLLK